MGEGKIIECRKCGGMIEHREKEGFVCIRCGDVWLSADKIAEQLAMVKE